MSIESVMLSNHLILFCPLLILSSVFTRFRVFSNELALCIRCPKYWSFSISLANVQGWFPLGLTGWISLQFKGLSRIFSSTTVQKHQFFSAQPSLGDDYSWQEIWVNHTVSEYAPISHNLQCLWWAYFLKSSFTWMQKEERDYRVFKITWTTGVFICTSILKYT